MAFSWLKYTPFVRMCQVYNYPAKYMIPLHRRGGGTLERKKFRSAVHQSVAHRSRGRCDVYHRHRSLHFVMPCLMEEVA